MFYIFALIAILLRLLLILCWWMVNPILWFITLVQQFSKLNVGVVQNWITFELAIRIHHSKGYSDISFAQKKKLKFTRSLLFFIVTVLFIAFTICMLVLGLKGADYFSQLCLIQVILGYFFLVLVLSMIFLVIWLFVETKRAVNREMQQNGIVRHTLRRERCTYAIISTFFILYYSGRFFVNDLDTCRNFEFVDSFYTREMILFIFYFIEGLSIGVLMLFHFENF